MMLRDWTEAESDAALFDMRSRLLTIPHSRGAVEVFVEVIPPPVPLVIFGGGHDAAPLVRIAKELGWHVTVADARPSYAQAHRFPHADNVILTRVANPFAGVDLAADSAVVLMNHDYEVDRKILSGVLGQPVKYVGVLGPRARTRKMLEDLDVPVPRYLHAPVGLDIGGDTPESIALSIVAEIQAVLSNRRAGMLKDSEGPIHAQSDARQEIALCA
jgi:xanthine/CO dehydrogenase XdhC/CoxF family maturation factor